MLMHPRAGNVVARSLLAGAVLAAVTLAAPARAAAQEVLLSRDQAVREVFPEVARTVETRPTLTADARRTLERSLGRPIESDTLVVLEVYDGGNAFRGYAVVTEEIGKYRPITFLVGVTPDLRVRDVTVMVYRESRGGDVKRKRFLSQYRGKSTDDPIDVGRDIINVSGATISVRSVNAGVRRVLAELALLYGPVPSR